MQNYTKMNDLKPKQSPMTPTPPVPAQRVRDISIIWPLVRPEIAKFVALGQWRIGLSLVPKKGGLGKLRQMCDILR